MFVSDNADILPVPEPDLHQRVSWRGSQRLRQGPQERPVSAAGKELIDVTVPWAVKCPGINVQQSEQHVQMHLDAWVPLIY